MGALPLGFNKARFNKELIKRLIIEQERNLTETQFAQIVGRMRLYQALSPGRQKQISRLLITDSQINSVCRDFYNSEHLPIHVHLENGDGAAKIALEPEIELIENNGIKPRDIKRAMSIVEHYKEEFIEKWNEFHGE